ncbi:MAG TPA: Ig-like domain-containing protein, partial [Acidimicrobiales bacterium]|nr:Ig-like domain-containing protein [Acidimicrobiales bacterium]
MNTSIGRRMGVLAGTICLATTGLVAAGATAVLAATPAGATLPAIPCPDPVIVGLTATVTCPFIAPGTNENPAPVQTWTAPAGVSQATVTTYGGAGGSSDGGGAGGTGGEASFNANLQPGQQLTIIVGGRGTNGNGNSSAPGGYGGAVGDHVLDGGSGGNGGPGNGAGGGGASSVNFGNGPQLVGAGGGGGGASFCGTDGGANGGGGGVVAAFGGADGAPGSDLCSGPNAGGGGTQSAGGAAGGGGAGGSTAGTPYFSGALGVGGDGGFAAHFVGARPALTTFCEGTCVGGGGGGGGISGGGGGGATGSNNTSGTIQPALPPLSGGGGGGGAGTAPDFQGTFPTCATCTGDGQVVITYQPIGTNPTTTTLVSSNNPSGIGETVTYTATVARSVINTAGPSGADGIPAPIGTVAFSDGGGFIPGCIAQPLSATIPDTATCTFTYSSTRGSPHPIVADYSGDPTYAPSESAVLSQVVSGGGSGVTVPTSITLTSSPNPSTGGEVVTYTATVSFPPSGIGSPTGTVTFFDNGIPIPGCINLPIGGSPPYTVSCSANYGPSSSIRTAHLTSKTTHLITASYSGNAVFGKSTSPALSQTVLGSSGQPTGFGTGYRLVAADGGVFDFGGLPFFGSMGGKPLNQPIVGMESPDGGGYWLVASDGGVFAFGDAGFFGSTGGMKLNKPIVGMATTPDGQGYWLVASDGGIFAFGDAGFFGSTGAQALNKPVVGMASTVDGGGYWLVASDGGIFAFGDAGFFGSTGGTPLNKPVVGMAPSDFPAGYWLVASDGGIFNFGGAGFFGSTGAQPLNQPIVGLAATPGGGGYWLAASDGGVFAFGVAGFAGSMGGTPRNQPIV